MLTLKSIDTSDVSTATSSIIKPLFIEEERAQRELRRLCIRRRYMIGFLQDFKEIPLEVWDAMLAHFDHSDLSPDEIYDIGKRMLEEYNRN